MFKYKYLILFTYILFSAVFTDKLIAQTVDLTSVDAFINIASTLKEGKKVSAEQWNSFNNSTCYNKYLTRKNQFIINNIKSSLSIAFNNNKLADRDSILNITQQQMNNNPALMFKKGLLTNYLNVNNNYESIKAFRNSYNFNTLIIKSKERLSSFLGEPLDTTIKLKPIYFLFITADGKNNNDALYIDFNLIYRKSEEQRIDFIAHEYFHNYREYFENNDFNHKCDLNYSLDMIQNEGIADLIDKSRGYKWYFKENGESAEMINIWVDLYRNAENDLKRLNNLIVSYSKNQIAKPEMVDKLISILRYNGHHIGFFMANNITEAGYRDKMLKTFYNPYQFYALYNKAAKKQNLFKFSNEFITYLKEITEEHYDNSPKN
jgi:hypothetical protein